MDDCYEVGRGVGVKFDKGKPRMSLVPQDSLRAVAGVFGYGADKYDEHNWAQGMRWTRMADALLRHVGAWIEGEDLDEESGHHHLAHAGCCLLMLLAMVVRGIGEDDRWKGV